jgi:hypothetical protein
VAVRGGGFRGNGFRGNGFRGNRVVVIRGGNRFGFGGPFFGAGVFPGFWGGGVWGGGAWGSPFWGDPGFVDSSFYDPGFAAGPGFVGYPSDNGFVSSAPAVQPAPSTIINQNFAGTPSDGYYRAADYYLIAFNDHTIQAAISYTVVGDTLRFITRQNETKMAPLSSVDLRFSVQINRDRRVEFRLP